MRRLCLLLTLTPLLVYCTFPDVRFDGDAGDDAGVSDAAADGGPTPEAGGGDAGDGGPDPCDRDQDGHRANTQACGGDDCNDNDARIHPGAGFVHDVPDAALLGDWNCDGTVDKEYPAVSCSQISTNCGSAMGFVIDPGCGETGAFVQCTGTIACTGADAGTRVQGCK